MSQNYTLKSNNVEIVVNSEGAELYSYKVNGTEFMWGRDPEVWGKSSPILFPFVGTIKDDKYIYNGKEYNITTRHGFARDYEFELVEKTEKSLKFKLSSNEKTLEIYPFEFDLYLEYIIEGDTLKLKYEVVNKTNEKMYFSLGAHPAFALEISETNENINEDGNLKISDYYLEFEKEETQQKYTFDGTLISEVKKDMLRNEKVLRLSDTIFDEDAVIFENTNSTVVTLKNDKNKKELKFDYTGFPFIAFWSKPKAHFVCIEPWYGISDFNTANGKLIDKKGIELLEGNKSFTASLKITGKVE